jgi:hypothetical protein
MSDIAGFWYLSLLTGTEEIEAKLFEVFRDTDPPVHTWHVRHTCTGSAQQHTYDSVKGPQYQPTASCMKLSSALPA